MNNQNYGLNIKIIWKLSYQIWIFAKFKIFNQTQWIITKFNKESWDKKSKKLQKALKSIENSIFSFSLPFAWYLRSSRLSQMHKHKKIIIDWWMLAPIYESSVAVNGSSRVTRWISHERALLRNRFKYELESGNTSHYDRFNRAIFWMLC